MTTKKIFFIICGLVGVLCLGGVFIAALAPDPRPNTEQRSAPEVGEVVKPTPVPSAKPVAKPKVPTTIGEGQYDVGKHVQPGRYRTAGAREGLFQSCIWSVRREGNLLELGSASETDEPQSVTLKSGQSFTSSGCADWKIQN